MRRGIDPAHLLSLSEKFETNARPRAAVAAMQDGLSLFAELGAITQASLPSGQAATPPQAAPAKASGEPAPTPSVNYESARPEYKPALKNPSVIDALLQLHRRSRSGARAEAPLSSFRPATVPTVEMPAPRKPTHKAR